MSYLPGAGALGAPSSLHAPGGPPGGPSDGGPLCGKAGGAPLEAFRPPQPSSLFGIVGGGIGFGLGVTSDWQQLAGVSYRRQNIFCMMWEGARILEQSVVAATPWGGPIAAVRNEKVFQPATNKLTPELQFFTARGRLVASLPWTFTRLVTMQWNDEEALVCVFADSVVRTFSPNGEKLHFFSLGAKIKSEGGGVIQAAVGKAGIAVVTSKNQVYINRAFDKASLLHLPTPVLRGPPLCICFISGPPLPPACQGGPSAGLLDGPPASLSEPRLLIATEEGALLLADRNGCTDLKIPEGPFVALAASRSGRFVAAVSNTGALQVLSVEGSSVRLAASASLDRSRRVRQIAWCGDDCLGVYVPLVTPSGNVQHLVLLGGPGSEWLPLDFGSGPRGSGGGVVLVDEVDGLRVVTAAAAELIQRVSPQTESVFGVGSCDPPAMLCYALERMHAQDAAAEESLRAIKPDLAAAAAACCEAATLELRSDTASFLLAASAFGRRFLDDASGPALTSFIRACRDIRICSCVKEGPLDMPLTVPQLRSLTLTRLVRRIANRHHHLLAFRICEYTGLSPRGVLVSWAVAKISRCTSLTDEELTEVVCSRMQAAAKLPAAAAAAAAAAAGGDPAATLAQSFFGFAAYKTAQQQRLLQLQQQQQQQLPFARLALCAAQAGRPVLATRLAAFEAEPRAQVSLLLKLAKVSLATRKAAEAADSDLLLQCIAAALAADADTPDGRVDMSQLVEALHDIPAAQSAFAVYCHQTGQLELLEQYYERIAAAQEAGLCCLSLAESAAAAAADWGQQRGWLAFAGGFFAAAREAQLLAAVAHSETLAALELLSIQRDLEVKGNTCGWVGAPHKFVGLSLMQTIRQLILKMEFEEADLLKKTFRVTDQRYWRCKIDALADGMHFDELLAFAQFRSSPIGYEPFVAACLRKGNREAALQLVYKVKDPQSRAHLLLSMGKDEEAAAALREGPQQLSF
ncbi:hypothetical protein Efla_003977 [Eimeria flavescens]